MPKDDCYARGSVGLVSKRKKIVNMSIFFRFSFFIEIISFVTECIFWQLSNQTYFGFHPNIKTCQKNLHTHHGINIKRHAVLDNWL